MKNKDLSEIQSGEHVLKLAAWFTRFAEQAQESKLYAFLSEKISEDHELLMTIPDNLMQPIPNLFLAAVNYLLYKKPNETLAYLYRSTVGHSEILYEEFRKFCLLNSKDIEKLMSVRLVQTNEVQRCALLMPAVALVAMKSEHPLTLIDEGTSSGLNLLMDQYFVQYSDGRTIGDEDSPVRLNCAVKGKPQADLSTPDIKKRIGIDLNTINLNDDDEFLWAQSLIWPDQIARIERFKNAANLFRKNNVDLRRGSALDLLAPVAQLAPADSVICVMHSFTLNQFSQSDRTKFDSILKEVSLSRDLWRISLEWLGTETPELSLQHFSSGEKVSEQTLAKCHQHGEWLHWAAI